MPETLTCLHLILQKGGCDKELQELKKVLDGQTEMGTLVEVIT